RTGFCAVFENELVTHPAENDILGSITREIVLDMCEELRIPVKERAVRESEIYDASELMILGTTLEIMPVVQVGERKVGNGTPGSVTRTLQKAYKERVAQALEHMA
ncbi:aminotransferase class IV, partial [candidate division KSB1 bacterium]